MQSYFSFFVIQKILLIPHFPCVMRAQRSFSPRAQNAIPEQDSTEGTIGWELAVNFFDFATRVRSRILAEAGTNFVTNSVPKSPKFFRPFFSWAQEIHSKSTSPAGPKSTPMLDTFSQWSFWVLDPGLRRCFWTPIFLC